ncbi:spore coat protein [Sporosarcina newyorkensis 2681]|uniref:Spore coat protein n=1 Tax=Sporosarcina newyorkensis 2681 TaxID=1027292 RepID=F9DUC9_9BACL|nr:spore coat protein [Sporosarcina newyorkensis]EGQ24727.1 spore coat protein [Sporosarcina newyorkensis 2681]
MMMNQGQYPGMSGQFPGMQGQQPGFQMQPIVCPTQYRYNDCFSPQEIPYIHPIVNVNRHNVVGVPQHYYTETTQDVMGSMIMPGRGPSHGHGHGHGMWGGGGCGRRRGCCR